MKIIFAGTPEFAAVALRRLCDAGWEVALVLTQPDRPAGRGMQLQPSAVKLEALSRGIAVCQPRGLRLDGKFASEAALAREAIQAARADVMVVAAYGLMLPQWLLDLMRASIVDGKAGLGCLNIHASLLPRWRGAAPIHRAIEAGDTRTGVCIMQMDAGLDTGDIVLCGEVPISQQGQHADTSGSLHDKLADLGTHLLLRALESAAQGRLQTHPQASEGVCYAQKVQKSQARVDWTRTAVEIERAIRAFDPAPGAWTEYADTVLKLWRADVVVAPSAHNASAGTVLAAHDAGIAVACGDGVLSVRELQRAGGKRLGAGAFLRGTALRVGVRLGAAAAAS